MATITFSTAELQALAKQVAPYLTPVGTPPVVTPPVVTPPAAGAMYIYQNGAGNVGWADWSYGSGKVDYAAKNPITGETCIAVIGDEGLQPYALSQDFDTSPYTGIIVSLMPTQAGYNWTVGAEMKGDTPIPGMGSPPSIMPYGPNPPVINKWNTYKIPKSLLGITASLHILKIAFQQHQGGSSLLWYAKDIAFVP